MAFQNVSVSNTKKATAMKVGETITGYVLRIEKSRKHEDQNNMVLKDLQGNEFMFFSAGNIRYLLNDGLIKIGLLTQITRIPDKTVKGKASSQFEVQQDSDKKLEFADIPTAATTATETDRSAIRNRAEQLSRASR